MLIVSTLRDGKVHVLTHMYPHKSLRSVHLKTPGGLFTHEHHMPEMVFCCPRVEMSFMMLNVLIETKCHKHSTHLLHLSGLCLCGSWREWGSWSLMLFTVIGNCNMAFFNRYNQVLMFKRYILLLFSRMADGHIIPNHMCTVMSLMCDYDWPDRLSGKQTR